LVVQREHSHTIRERMKGKVRLLEWFGLEMEMSIKWGYGGREREKEEEQLGQNNSAINGTQDY
jgi:hypothetical protein